MYPPLCCIGSRQVSASALQAACSPVWSQLHLSPQQPVVREQHTMSVGIWQPANKGAWLLCELLPFAHNPAPISTLLTSLLAKSLGQPLEALLINTLSQTMTLDTPPDTPVRIAYARHRIYPNGQQQPLRHPIADKLVGENGYDGPAAGVVEPFLQAVFRDDSQPCTPQQSIAHRCTPRQLGLMMLLANTMGQPLQIRQRKTHFELEIRSTTSDDVLVHFLNNEDIRYLKTISTRFGSVPLLDA